MKHIISEEAAAAFDQQMASWGLSLAREGQGLLSRYARELASYGKANVVGVKDIDRLWLEHILDSLSCLLYGPLRRISSLVDVGTGGGMPGLPLHIAAGFQKTCLLESTGKKAEFLRYATAQTEVEGVEVVDGRAEDIGQSPAYRGCFEAATARAVAHLGVISEYCIPLLAPDGIMIAMKGRLSTEELESGGRAASVLGGELEEVIRIPFSSEAAPKERHLVVIRKVRNTPELYPRRPGMPRKSPIAGVE